MLGPRALADDVRVLIVVAVLFAAAWFTDEIGLYAVFGAFSVGLVMPRGVTAERTVATVSTGQPDHLPADVLRLLGPATPVSGC